MGHPASTPRRSVTTRYLRVALGAGLLTACGPSSVWRTLSPDHRTTVEVADWQDRTCVREGGHGNWCFDGVAVHDVTFSFDSRHVAYPALLGDRWTVVRDGQIGALWNGVGPPMFSPDGRRLAYAAFDGQAWRVVLDDVAGEPVDSVYAGSMTFDRSGKQLAYAAQRGGRSYAVIAGRPGPPYDGIANITFNVDGSRVAYTARVGGEALVILDGAVRETADAVGELAFSDDGDRFAYTACHGGTWYVVDGIAVLGPFDSVQHVTHQLGSRQLTFIAGVGGQQAVMSDAMLGPTHESIEPPVFARSGSRWGYIAHDSASSTVVVDGAVLRQEELAGSLAISPDGRRIAYMAWRGDEAFVVDDAGAHPFDLLVNGTLVFSEDGRTWACLAGDRQRRRLFVTVDGTFRTPKFDWSELMQIAWRESLEGNRQPPTNSALREWVAAELAIALMEYDRERGR